MLRYTFVIFLQFLLVKTNAQVIELYDKLVQKVNDTTITLQYFKNVDSALLNKLDSFDLHLAEIKYELDSNYFYFIDIGLIRRYSCRKEIAIRYGSQYCDYISVANLGRNKRRSGSGTPFGFFFYKKRLVFCCMYYRPGLNLSGETTRLLTNLIYENVDASEKKLILGHPQNEYNVLGKPGKSYFID